MAAQPIQPVPNYALPFIGNEDMLRQLGLRFNPQWLAWFLAMIDQLTSGAAIDHNGLNNLQGGNGVDQFYHFTSADYNLIIGPHNANLVFAGPASGAAAAAAFRALVNADFPASGVTADTYTYATVVVNAQGIITAAADGTAPVTSVGVTAPITTTGGTTPTIGITLGANVATFLATPSSANLATAMTDEAGSGLLVFQDQNSWTPTDVSGASLSFSAATGYYIRTGNMMYAMGSVTYPVNVDVSSAIIGSLPATAKNVSTNRGGSVSRSDYGSGLTMRTLENTAKIYIYDLTGASITNTQLSGITIDFNAAYVVA